MKKVNSQSIDRVQGFECGICTFCPKEQSLNLPDICRIYEKNKKPSFIRNSFIQISKCVLKVHFAPNQ